LAKTGGVVHRLKIFLTSSLITQNLVAVSHHVCAHVRGHNNLETFEAPHA